MSSAGEERQSYAAAAMKQPSAKSENNDNLASDIAQRKTGDPGAYERASNRGSSYESSHEDGGAKGPPSAEKLKKPLIISGVVIALVGAFIALVLKSKDETSTSTSTSSDTRRVD